MPQASADIQPHPLRPAVPETGTVAALGPPPADLTGWSVITAERPLLDLQLRELWRYRDLIVLFFKRDFVATYKQTVLGPIWFFAQPIMTSLVFWVVFGRVGKIMTRGVPQVLFFMAGIVIWNFFSNCFTNAAGTLSNNTGLFSKVYFPRLAVPISGVLTNSVILATQFGCFWFFFAMSWLAGHPVYPKLHLLLIPLLVLDTAALAIGTGLIVAAMTTRFRDLAIAATFGVQLLMFASCVVFPVAETIGEDWRWLIYLNPLVTVIETFRLGVLGFGETSVWHLTQSCAISGLLLLVGLVMFNRAEATAQDTV
jgi:lipopolysaccharide transport system permease protein